MLITILVPDNRHNNKRENLSGGRSRSRHNTGDEVPRTGRGVMAWLRCHAPVRVDTLSFAAKSTRIDLEKPRLRRRWFKTSRLGLQPISEG